MTPALTKIRRALTGGVFAASLLMLAAGQAAADTYAIVINATETTLNINGVPLASRAGAWTPLDAQIVLNDGTIAHIMDMHAQCADGGWLLMGMAKLPTTMCISLGVAEVGCILAAVSVDKATNLERIDMVKTRGTNCSDRWWEQSGKEIISEAASSVISLGSAAMAAAGAAAGAP